MMVLASAKTFEPYLVWANWQDWIIRLISMISDHHQWGWEIKDRLRNTKRSGFGQLLLPAWWSNESAVLEWSQQHHQQQHRSIRRSCQFALSSTLSGERLVCVLPWWYGAILVPQSAPWRKTDNSHRKIQLGVFPYKSHPNGLEPIHLSISKFPFV